ncbi:thiamine pyrophosphate-dependent enzyme, partial [Haloarculaceae archaeon H-GB1-1]|nr:thiamine pyrophosphate-dependent enzyme [Haloarculaceae archaeon H-GB1-1]
MSERSLLSRPPDDRVQFLDDDGHLLDGVTEPDLGDRELVTMYERMVLSRHLDERAISLQRQGRMGTYPSLAGQEAAQVASAQAMAHDDWLLYQYREHGSVAARGLAPEYLLYWMGHEIGNEWLADRHVFPLNISIAGHIPHATGMAWASKLQDESRTFVC